MNARIPSKDLSALIQRWIDEARRANWPNEVFMGENALLIAGNQAFLWGLTPAGEILCLDTDSVRPPEPETDARHIDASLASASEHHPELRELIPEKPPAVERCSTCGGTGVSPDGVSICSCGGLRCSV